MLTRGRARARLPRARSAWHLDAKEARAQRIVVQKPTWTGVARVVVLATLQLAYGGNLGALAVAGVALVLALLALVACALLVRRAFRSTRTARPTQAVVAPPVAAGVKED